MKLFLQMCITATSLSRKFGTKDKIPEQNGSGKEENYFDETDSTQSQTFIILSNLFAFDSAHVKFDV